MSGALQSSVLCHLVGGLSLTSVAELGDYNIRAPKTYHQPLEFKRGELVMTSHSETRLPCTAEDHMVRSTHCL